jgi:hypothetical protein
MSFLYPLLLAGVAAVALPIVLHMIRRHTRKRVTFSSLMFLRTTAPRLRNRSRPEHLLLLILRCLILCLLAFAFARPFLPRSTAARLIPPGRRIVLLLDTSASMRRAGVWDRAISEARSPLSDAGPSDRVCVMTFDQGTRTLVGFDQWATLEPSQRFGVAIRSLSAISPGWGATNLGQALITAAEMIEDDEVGDEQQTIGVRRIVLIGDMQQGGNLDALLAYEWPEQIELSVRAVPAKGTTNASLQLVTTRDPLAPARQGDLPRVRVTNSPDATKEHFQLRWADGTTETMDVYVPPGHSVVVQAPPRSDASRTTQLILTGDDHDFDNALYIAPPLEWQVDILYIGNDEANDVRAMLYYVRQAFGPRAALSSQVASQAGNAPLREARLAAANLVIVADAVTQANAALLRRYIESGRTLLLVLRSPEAAATLAALSGREDLDVREAEVNRYAMLDSIDLRHPLFVLFSDPRFGDFTRIHFWKYRRLGPADDPQARVLARFDSGDPAWIEFAVGNGSLLVWTSGWHPSDSDLALSSKFVPLLYSILEHGGTLADRQSQYFVTDAVPIPAHQGERSPRVAEASAIRRIRRPDASVVELEAMEQVFTQTDHPGLYALESPAGNRLFAVNLNPAESRTEPMPIEEIERMGISLGPGSDVAPQVAAQAARHSSFAQMESEQKLWRWVLLATLAMLLIEIWLGGWLIRTRPGSEGE